MSDPVRRAKLTRWSKRAQRVYEALADAEFVLNELGEVFPDNGDDDTGLLACYARDVLGATRAARAMLANGMTEYNRIKAKK